MINHRDAAIYKMIKILGNGCRKQAAKSLDISVYKIRRWLNEHSKVPYEIAISIERKTKGQIKAIDLYEKQEENIQSAYNYIEDLKSQLIWQYTAIKNIKPVNFFIDEYVANSLEQNQTWNRPLIVDENYNLIACPYRLAKLQSLKQQYVKTLIIDLDEYLKKLIPYQQQNLLNLTEKMALAQAVKHRLGQRRGRPTLKNKKCHIYDTFPKRSDDIIAIIAGFSSRAQYHNFQQLYQHSAIKLIQQVEQKTLSLAKAVKLLSGAY